MTCVASTDRYLTTTQALKDRLGVTATSDDAKLSVAILSASRWAETYIGYPLTVQSYSEAVPTFGGRRMMLKRTPLRAVSRVLDSTSTEDASELESTEYRVEDPDAGFLTRDLGWEWTVPGLPGGLTPTPAVGQEYKPWLVDYVAGWTYAGVDTGSANWSTAGGTTSTGRTLPEDIEEAVLAKAGALYENTDGLDGERLGDLEVRYNARSVQADQPEPYAVLLDPYRRWV